MKKNRCYLNTRITASKAINPQSRNTRQPRLNAWLLLCLCTLFIYTGEAAPLAAPGQSRWVEVKQIFDGDTFRTRSGERIRLLGINAPEVAHHHQAAQPYAQAASRLLRQLILGQRVRIQLDRQHKDIYQRTLAQVYLADGRWVNAIMLRAGMAQVYTFAPNFYHTALLLKAEQQARLAMRGMWASPRFSVIPARQVSAQLSGQFRLIRGIVGGVHAWRFKFGPLTVSIPRKARRWFSASDLPSKGQALIVRGVIHTSITGHLYLAIYSPFNIVRL